MIRAVPGAGLRVPIWILGSSLFGARLAGRLGLPYAFASHFAPSQLMSALDIYRREFRPSSQLEQPYAAAGVNAIAAETDAEARRLFTSVQQSFLNLVRGTSGQLLPPVDDMDSRWSPTEKAQASAMLKYSFVGSSETVGRALRYFQKCTGVDELFVVSAIHDHAARLRSYELLADVVRM